MNSDLSMAWLKPFMTERKCTTGEVLFYKHEQAERIFIVSGRYGVSPASSCPLAPLSANSECCRHRTKGLRRSNVSKGGWSLA